MPLRFYYDFLSQPSRAVHLFLKTNKIRYIYCVVKLLEGKQLTPEYESINPFKKVPAIDHDGFKLSESVAILRYLSRAFKTPDHWYPQDSHAQAKIDEFLAWYHLNIRLNASMYFQTKYLIPLMTKEPVNEKQLNRYERGLKESLTAIENVFLARGPFMCNQPDINIADLLCICEIEQPLAVNFNMFDSHPKLLKWKDLVQTKLMPQYNEAHKYIHRIRKANSEVKNYQHDSSKI